MLEEYKRVLERRRNQMLEQIRWNKEISKAFLDSGLFSRSDIQEIEVRVVLDFTTFMVLRLLLL